MARKFRARGESGDGVEATSVAIGGSRSTIDHTTSTTIIVGTMNDRSRGGRRDGSDMLRSLTVCRSENRSTMSTVTTTVRNAAEGSMAVDAHTTTTIAASLFASIR